MHKKQFDVLFPAPGFFEPPKTVAKRNDGFKTEKRQEAYNAYIRWSALPKQIREPSTTTEFERLYKLAPGYASKIFAHRKDYHERKLKYFWKWMFDKAPDVVYAVYRRAIRKSTADAKVFLDLIGKKMEAEAPKPKMQPFMMIGVPQEKLDKLFVPETMENVVEGEEVDA
jgi:hypothetical protein